MSLLTGLVGSKGGSERLTIASNVAQGADEVCRRCIIIPAAANAGTVRVQIGAACTATTGIPIPKHAATALNHLVLEIENKNLLYFYGTNDNDIVDILWIF